MEQVICQVGQYLYFTTDSKLYRDVYKAEVMKVHPDHLDLRLSLHGGYLLLLPVGTKIRWVSEGARRLDLTSEVLSRNLHNQVWSVTLPEGERVVPKRTRVIAVGSGKGGVGKTTFSINLSLALSRCHQNVVLMDADIGMANVDVLLGMSGSLNLGNVISGECSLSDIITEGPGGLRILPGSSGISSLTQLDPVEFNRILSGFKDLENDYDILILDTGAGISELVLKFLEAADDFLLLTTPEPHAMMDAYSLVKVLAQRNPGIAPYLIMNRCTSEREAQQSSESFSRAAKKFLEVSPILLGWLPDDKLISRSLKERVPLFLSNPQTDFSRRIYNVAQQLAGINEKENARESGLQAFWSRFKRNLV